MNLSKDFKVQCQPVTDDKALEYAAELELAIGEIMTGQRNPRNMPVEPIMALIQYARDKAKGGAA